MGNAGRMTAKKMFGEYALYCDGTFVALVCDNRLFVKPTDLGRAYIGAVVEAPPYPEAKLYFLIEDQCEDRDWISELIKLTVEGLNSQEKKPERTRITSRTPRKRAHTAP